MQKRGGYSRRVCGSVTGDCRILLVSAACTHPYTMHSEPPIADKIRSHPRISLTSSNYAIAQNPQCSRGRQQPSVRLPKAILDLQNLKNYTLRPLLLANRGSRTQDSSYSLVKDAFQISLGERGTLQIFCSLDVFRYLNGLFVGNRLHLLAPEVFQGCRILSQVQLCTNKYNRYVGCMMLNFRIPLGLHIVK